MRQLLKFFLLPTIAIMATFMACNKNEDTTTVEEYVDEALYSVQERGGMGRFGCYELVFPVSFTLPDETVVEANSYEDIKTALRNYFTNNPGQGGQGGHSFIRRINFVFPISVINQDGAVITVADQEALKALREACPGTFGNHGHNGHGQNGLSCFEIIFPITLTFADGTTAAVNNRLEFRQAIRQWNANNPGQNGGRPQITFPITIKMTDDGSIITVNSREELRTIKENCE